MFMPSVWLNILLLKIAILFGTFINQNKIKVYVEDDDDDDDFFSIS